MTRARPQTAPWGRGRSSALRAVPLPGFAPGPAEDTRFAGWRGRGGGRRNRTCNERHACHPWCDSFAPPHSASPPPLALAPGTSPPAPPGANGRNGLTASWPEPEASVGSILGHKQETERYKAAGRSLSRERTAAHADVLPERAVLSSLKSRSGADCEQICPLICGVAGTPCSELRPFSRPFRSVQRVSSRGRPVRLKPPPEVTTRRHHPTSPCFAAVVRGNFSLSFTFPYERVGLGMRRGCWASPPGAREKSVAHRAPPTAQAPSRAEDGRRRRPLHTKAHTRPPEGGEESETHRGEAIAPKRRRHLQHRP